MSLPSVKSAVKRKQRGFPVNADTVKHRRPSVSLAVVEDIIIHHRSADGSVEWSADDALTDVNSKAVKLQLLLEHERKQSSDFEVYLQQVLSDSDCKTLSPADRPRPSAREPIVDSSVDTRSNLAEQLCLLQSTLKSEHDANRLFELQLMQICLYD